ncbi:MAG TPA: thiamine pyrophosphate-binding protein [Marmoricola sp.]|nr:thiamine pyrophosphate-binding protein [Marmoricola sp.]
MTTVAELVGRTLVEYGVGRVFGVVGSGNFAVTNAMLDAGARYVAARHEGGAATMADACARMGGGITALTVHQGCGLTNAMTGLTEAAKSRTPMLVLAAEATQPRSNFYVDQPALAEAVGMVPLRVDDPASAADRVREAFLTARDGRRVVLLNLPLEVQAAPADDGAVAPLPPTPPPVQPDPGAVERLAEALRRAERPVFVAGRGARGSRAALEDLADRCGALLATSAVAKGLFHGNPWSLDVSGGFSSPLVAELISSADLLVGWGCALNMWTMRHGRLVGAGATVVQVDAEEDALGAHREVDLGVVGDVRLTAEALALLTTVTAGQEGYRTAQVREALAARGRWRDVPVEDRSGGGRIDPRTLSRALDDLLPADRVVAVDSGNFMGYPSAWLDVPDELGFCFTQAYQSIGLGLATAIGAALAQPERLPVAALGDGGALMGASELDTVRRLGLPLLVVVYNDDGYGAEVHHFAGSGQRLDTVTFPDTDIAAVARGYGFRAETVRSVADLSVVSSWLEAGRPVPLLLDAKVVADEPSWWLAEAFGH